MGYHSEVGLKAQFTTISDRDRVIGLLNEEQRTMVRQILTIPADRPVLYGYFGDIKWYTGEYEEVNAVEALVDLCEYAADGAYDMGLIPNAGFFARVGEDNDDNEERYWQPSYEWLDGHPGAGLPDPYDMGRIRRFVEMDED